ncbi:MAG: GNAT family N-acetyltransferase [Anaerolineae bacterium]|nr:GNAT family N-acetyltransferase [Anaerolineae bacterium]
MNETRCTLRPARLEDEEFLWQILYQAIYVGPEEAPPPVSILDEPAIAQYLQGWGRAHDYGWIAENPANGAPLGAAWFRRWQPGQRGYGFFRDDIPELTIALLPEARGMGIGTELMQRLIETARQHGYPGLSLSVARENPAVSLYQRLGFQEVGGDDHSAVMVLFL